MELAESNNTFKVDKKIDNRDSRLGLCEVCNITKAKYTCPRCEVKTCCLKCNKIHKVELECDGTRDKTKFVPLKKMTNFDLSSDYRMLEEVTRSVEGYKKSLAHKFINGNRELPHHLFKLKQHAGVNKTNLKFLPPCFVKRKQNKTFLHFKTNTIYWQIECIFVNADNLRIINQKVAETDKLCTVLNKCFTTHEEKLQYYKASDITGIRIFLKAEQCAGNKFFEVDVADSVKENLRGKIIVEYPTFYVVLKEHADIFNTVDAEENSRKDYMDTSDRIVENILRSAERDDELHSLHKNLLFVSDNSDEELSDHEL